MKRLIPILTVLMMAVSAMAASQGQRCRYWLVAEKGHIEITQLGDVFDMVGKQGALYQYGCYNAQTWKAAIPVADRPTLAQLAALDGPTVDAWVLDQKKDEEATLKDIDPVTKAAVLGLMDAFNAKLPAQYRITVAELKAAVKARL